MKHFFSILITLALVYNIADAQSKLTGTITEETEHKPVKNAVIALLTPKDSILYRFTRSDENGKYALKNVAPGNYILLTTHPYYADLLDNVSITADLDMPAIALLSKVKLLQEVIIKSGSPMKIRGDTTIYTADSFKVSANANVEELLKKLPGIQVDKDGKIKAMGETVQKVLVDGEEFFGDDPGMAVKNLRADAVKEVRVFDKKSDQAEFTGIDDGKTQKTIDLRLKEDKKTGYFGKIDAAGGLQKNIPDRYNTNLMFSSFKGKRKLSAFLLNGNTGQDGLNWQDEQKFGGGDNIMVSMDDDGGIMIMGGGGGSSDGEPYLDIQNGFMTNVNAGGSYSNKWTDAHSLNYSPRYNSQDYNNHKQSFTQTQVGDSLLNDRSDVNTHVKRYNIKNRLTYDLKLDSNNSIRVNANANYYHSESRESRSAESTGGSGILKNSSSRLLETGSDKTAVSGNIIFKHKFKKLRRTLSVNADWNILNSDGTNFLQSNNQSYLAGIAAGSQKLNQMKDYEQGTRTIATKVIYTEPLNKQYSLELSYQLGYNYGTNNQLTYSYSPVSGKYDITVDSLSNQFRQTIIQNIPSARINFSNKKFKINAGSGFGFTNFELDDITYSKEYNRQYVNFFPSGNVVYTYKPNHSIRLNYNGNTRQPSINQLQPLRNNNDYYNQYIGNPNLKPSFANSFNLSHNSYNFIKDIYTYISMNARFTHNSITNSRTINVDSGKTITQPVNTNGNVSGGLYSGMGFKIKKIDSRININAGGNYNRYAEIINNKPSFNKTLSANMSLGIYKSKEKKYDLSLRDDIGYNLNTTSQSNTTTHYMNNNVSGDATVYIDKVWSVKSDYQFTYRQKTPQFNKSLTTHIWNARLQRTFRENEFTAYILVRDILNQNIGIDRSLNGNRYSETINDRLKRYFLVGFTWDFKNKPPKPAANVNK